MLSALILTARRQSSSGREKKGRKSVNVRAGCVGVPVSVYTERKREGADEPHSMLGMVLRGTPRFIPPPQQNPPKH